MVMGPVHGGSFMRLRCVVSGLSESTDIDLGVSYSRGHNAFQLLFSIGAHGAHPF